MRTVLPWALALLLTGCAGVQPPRPIPSERVVEAMDTVTIQSMLSSFAIPPDTKVLIPRQVMDGKISLEDLSPAFFDSMARTDEVEPLDWSAFYSVMQTAMNSSYLLPPGEKLSADDLIQTAQAYARLQETYGALETFVRYQLHLADSDIAKARLQNGLILLDAMRTWATEEAAVLTRMALRHSGQV